jgi:predicted ATPase
MWLKDVDIRNFRTIDHLHIEFDRRTNVIVGPNAVGKTTLLEALRLTKAALAPRTAGEMQHAFISLGAISPHNPQAINYSALIRDLSRPLEIEARFELTLAESQMLDSLISDVATSIVRASLGPGTLGQGPLALVQYLSSPHGIAQLTAATTAVTNALAGIKSNGFLLLKLKIDSALNTINGSNQIDQLIFQTMEARLAPNQAIFSYFPADRAIPTGEINIQIGGPDSAAQLESHNSQPQTKFQRLKPTIVNNYLFNEATRATLTSNFKSIFLKILKDRELVGISVNQLGLVTIQIKDVVSNRVFDIDGMSSGEKGLILTFLLISQSVAAGGVIMIDEPELHLNPAVCKTLLPFIIDELLVPKDIQAIICSHSPEILGSAFDSSLCTLLHLQSSTVISKIYPEDKREVFDALRRLGTSASEVLFAAGSIFVEGEHDIEVLRAGFEDLIVKYNLTQLGGRGNVEKEIATLQEAEKRNEIDTLKCFIFDLDNAPTSLESSKLVKVLQWKRRCLENYLIDEKIIYDLLRDEEIAKRKIDTRGQVHELLKAMAISQLREVVATFVYKKMAFDNPGLRPREIHGKSYDDMAGALFSRLQSLSNQVSGLQEIAWKKDFTEKCNAEHALRLPDWETEWTTLCDGKRFFHDLHQTYGVKVSPLKLKKWIIERMGREKTDAWVLVEKFLTDGLKIA